MYNLQQQFDLHIAARWLLEAALYEQKISSLSLSRKELKQYFNLELIRNNLELLNKALNNSEDNSYQEPLFLENFLNDINNKQFLSSQGESDKNLINTIFANTEVLIPALKFLIQNINSIESNAQVVTLARIQQPLVEDLHSYLIEENVHIAYASDVRMPYDEDYNRMEVSFTNEVTRQVILYNVVNDYSGYLEAIELGLEAVYGPNVSNYIKNSSLNNLSTNSSMDTRPHSITSTIERYLESWVYNKINGQQHVISLLQDIKDTHNIELDKIEFNEVFRELEEKSFYDALLIIIDKVKEKNLEYAEEIWLEEVEEVIKMAGILTGILSIPNPDYYAYDRNTKIEKDVFSSYTAEHPTFSAANSNKTRTIPSGNANSTVTKKSEATISDDSVSYISENEESLEVSSINSESGDIINDDSLSYTSEDEESEERLSANRGLKICGVTAATTIATAAIMNQLYKNLSVTVLSSLSVAVVSTTLMYLCTRSNNQPSPTLTSTEGKPVTSTQEVVKG